MLPAQLRSLIVAAVVALVLYVVLRRLCTAQDSASKKSPRRRSGGGAGRTSAKRIAPQKVDAFTAAVCAAVPDMTPDVARSFFPRKFEVHGHVVVLRLNDGTALEEFRPLARFFAESFAPVVVDVVLLDADGIVGELRRPSLQALFVAETVVSESAAVLRRTVQRRWADSQAPGRSSCVTAADVEDMLQRRATSPTFTAHVENGVLYSFDVSRVMFSSGNTTERMHFGAVAATGDVVVDMFAGIGYFTLPLAMHGGVAAIHALEKNPDSVDFIRLNAVLNRVDHLIHPVCGDNREVGEALLGTCDRVLMGYIPSCKSFLPRAVAFLKLTASGRPRGIVHYHLLAERHGAAQTALQDVRDELGEDAAAGVRLVALRCVKSYAPKRFHFVADLHFE
ncbi:Met-10+ like-protein/Methyltransferase domain containing protein [Novymonas esmeraldas]|uniref:Met-10+ like-protein/Methyltransferase domain containing protein n=1 Tax=Novymonas esmeraldas TaxID=1808958 RepID=A0AAW0EP60_9TRYP